MKFKKGAYEISATLFLVYQKMKTLNSSAFNYKKTVRKSSHNFKDFTKWSKQ